VANDVLGEVEAALRAMYEVEPRRASTSFVGVEPIEVLRFDTGELVSYVSLGMSRHPMSAADSYATEQDGPRAELLVQSRGDAGELWRRLTVLAAAPMVEGVVYSEGMTVDLGVPLDSRSACTGALITASAIESIATAAGPVAIFRVLPATSTELAWSRVHGAALLQERWEQQHTDLLDLNRIAAALG
jgi:hypothetical protein